MTIISKNQIIKVDGKVENNDCEIFLDTCTSLNVITRSVLEKFKITKEPVGTLNETIYQAYTNLNVDMEIYELEITIGSYKFKEHFRVIKKDDIFDILIGIDSLKLNRFDINLVEDTLYHVNNEKNTLNWLISSMILIRIRSLQKEKKIENNETILMTLTVNNMNEKLEKIKTKDEFINEIINKLPEEFQRFIWTTLIDDIFLFINRNSKILTTINLFSGYHKIPMCEEDKDKTAFTTMFGNYNFEVMPFGLCNTSASFQREMNLIFFPLIGICLFLYIDGLIIFSNSIEEHIVHLYQVFKILNENNLKINIEKCSFFKTRVELLGHILTTEGISPIPDKSDECTKAFEDLKKRLAVAPILSPPDYGKPLIIRADASRDGLGGVLLQKSEDGSIEVPHYFESRTLKPAEINYSITDLEGKAVFHCDNKFKSYIT
eukprot:jgi/Orpsp1_1/1174656/evm.model.c7180000050888.1